MKETIPELKLKGRTVLVGIGNRSRGDDAAGLKVVDKVGEKIDREEILFLNTGTVPEKYTSKIKEFEPDNILLIDSVEIEEEPGTVSLVDPDGILKEKVSSHRLPLSMLIEYLEEETDGEVFFIGIQPKRLDIGDEMSEPVRESIEYLVEILIDSIE